jgi:flagellar protein FlaG
MSDSGMTVKPAVAATPPASKVQPAGPQVAATVQAPAKPQDKPQAPPPSVDIEAVARQLESFLKRVSRELEFHVDGSSGRVVCSVRDSQTGDLIRQIPNEEVLRLAELAHDETIVLVSERA